MLVRSPSWRRPPLLSCLRPRGQQQPLQEEDHAQAAAALYSRLALLRLGAIPIAVWLLRMIRLARRGEGEYDPVVFVTRDTVGLSIAALGIALAVLAI